jgi:hypothetical protein
MDGVLTETGRRRRWLVVTVCLLIAIAWLVANSGAIGRLWADLRRWGWTLLG